MRVIAVIIFLGVFTGCGFSEYKAREDVKTKAIVKAVTNSESVITGTKTVDALSFALAASDKYIKVGGWTCNKNVNDGSYDVWLDLTVNDVAQKLHWVVDSENNLFPANDLAQKITIRQKLVL